MPYTKNMKRQVVLAIIDGWGIGTRDASNPAYAAGTPWLDYIRTNFPIGALQASGVAVGLPWGEEGNSEVGHLTIGAGTVIYQHYPRISLAIRNGSFYKNKAFLDAIVHVKKNKSALNLAGLLSEGNVHSSLEHLLALIDLAQKEGIADINLHLFADGKDGPPRSLEQLLAKLPFPPASISGRYYALDRDAHWDRTAQTYRAMTGASQPVADVRSLVESSYRRGLNDQFIEPHAIGPGNRGIKDGDALIFFDFREDGIRQIAEAFINKKFEAFPATRFADLRIVTMTAYSASFDVPVAFPQEAVSNPLGRVLSDSGKSQLRIAETEKYAHITYFFNGLREPAFKNEFRVLIPSKNVPRYDEFPAMMTREITARAIQAVYEGAFDFLLINYASADMIAHTGNYEAGSEAVKVIDEEIGKLAKAVLEKNAILIITSDHGNIERMIDPMTALPTTGHDPSPVPFYLVDADRPRKKSLEEAHKIESGIAGILSDVAPTVLELMNLPKPPEMKGQSLLPFLE